MKHTTLRTVLSVATAPIAVAMMIAAGPVHAQDTAKAAAADDKADAPDADQIIVTGSRITNPNASSTVPIVSVTAQELLQHGGNSIGDTLNDLPSIRSTFSQQNSTRFLGTTGLNLIDLRGLGTQRSLVLVDGRRHVAGDILNNATSPDINTIPQALIKRVDLVTGGDSAVYGSDALAGVVNFILEDQYDGAKFTAKSGLSTYGDAGSYYGSGIVGKNFADGRGNIAVAFEYSHQDAAYGSERRTWAQPGNFIVTDIDPAGLPNGSDGVPDRQFYEDTRSTTISNGGLLSFASRSGRCGRDAAGSAFNCTYLFQPDGTLVAQTGTRVGVGPNGTFVGGNGSTLREGQQQILIPVQDRYVAEAVGHYEITNALVPFIDFKYARIDTTGSTSGPAFFTGSTLDAFLERPRFDNPYLTDQARAVIQAARADGGLAPATASTRITLRRNLLDLGVRNELSHRDTIRIVGGFKGDLGSNWHYEVSGNYGEFKESTIIQGNLNVQRFLLGIDSTRNSAGNIVCRSQVTPSAANDAQVVDNAAILAADVAACVPINPFGLGNISDAARRYVIQDTVSHGKITQLVAGGFISGDSSKWFELPGGALSVAAGVEYRRDTASYTEDPLVEQGYTFYNAIPSFTPPATEVKEIYGELNAPLIKDTFLLKELTVSAAVRVADYSGRTGTVTAYNAGAVWSPVKGIRIRGNYSHSVRAPNLTELYTPNGQNFATVVDPCSARNIGTGSATRAANCAAAGAPAGYDFVYSQSLEVSSGGNPNLVAETSDSFTIGAVIQPPFIPGLTISADYYDIDVNNVISAPSAQAILDNCYDSPTLQNRFCDLFQRNGSGVGPRGEVAFQVLEGSLQQNLLNYAKLVARGVDTDISYNHSFGPWTLGGHLVWTHVLQRDQFLDLAFPNRADQLLGELGDPEDAFNLNLTASRGKIHLGYQLRYIGPQFLGAAENIVSVNGQPPQNADFATIDQYPATFYHAIRGSYDVTKKLNVYAGVDNLLNTTPPYGLTGVGGGSGIYNNLGLYFFMGAEIKL